MEKQDYYDVLKVDRNASADDIKRAYRKLAKQYHPDVSKEKDAESKFKAVNEAYEVLSDASKRAKYDKFGHQGVDPQFEGAAGGFGGFEDLFKGFGSFFRGGNAGHDFFGGQARRKNQPQRGQDIETTVSLNLKEVMFGSKVKLNVDLIKTCETCKGSRAASKKDVHKCKTCNGHGIVRMRNQTMMGVIETEGPCPDCHGDGVIISRSCLSCHGQGRYRVQEKININLSRSLNHQSTVRTRNTGHYGVNGGERGDIYLHINVKPSKFYWRENYDLHLNLKVSYLDALLGSEVIVPTLDGQVKTKLKENTQNNTIIRIAKYGFYYSSRGERRGDLLVHINMQIPPKKPNKEERKIFEKLRERTKWQPRNNPDL